MDSRYAIRVGINSSVVKGNVEARFTKRFIIDGVEKPSFVMGSAVYGNIRLGRNMAKFVVRANEVDGNIQAFYNKGRIRIVANYVDGNITCMGNMYLPYLRDNYVNGNIYCR